mmetsp:Transcript_40281/g.94676  ORF Transcript_40281/g.94676 Transcript_40281/m.94676 type:complete len:213 (-) Transcript_40281:831-1469(-)
MMLASARREGTRPSFFASAKRGSCRRHARTTQRSAVSTRRGARGSRISRVRSRTTSRRGRKSATTTCPSCALRRTRFPLHSAELARSASSTASATTRRFSTSSGTVGRGDARTTSSFARWTAASPTTFRALLSATRAPQTSRSAARTGSASSVNRSATTATATAALRARSPARTRRRALTTRRSARAWGSSGRGAVPAWWSAPGRRACARPT